MNKRLLLPFLLFISATSYSMENIRDKEREQIDFNTALTEFKNMTSNAFLHMKRYGTFENYPLANEKITLFDISCKPVLVNGLWLEDIAIKAEKKMGVFFSVKDYDKKQVYIYFATPTKATFTSDIVDTQAVIVSDIVAKIDPINTIDKKRIAIQEMENGLFSLQAGTMKREVIAKQCLLVPKKEFLTLASVSKK